MAGFNNARTITKASATSLDTRQDDNKKSRIRETPTLSTDADSRTNTNLKRLVYFFLLRGVIIDKPVRDQVTCRAVSLCKFIAFVHNVKELL